MGWDRKKRGSSNGYFYLSQRIPGKPHPVKVYMGRGARGHETAAEIERRREDRRKAAETIRSDQDATAEADRLTTDLTEWAELLSAAWLILTGHECHRGEWRKRRG